MTKRRTNLILCVCLVLCCYGCPFPGSYVYRPSSEWERKVLERSRFDVYPGDVRKNLTAYRSVAVAWPGVILESHFVEREKNVEVILLVEHHYYDWILDYSVQREKFFLSPRGEGQFKTSWFIKKASQQSSEVRKAAEPSNMVLVYGTPEIMEGETIVLKSSYIRPIMKEWYRMDILDYGRAGEPAKLKKIP